MLVVHPVMWTLGGGERLCCETIRALLLRGHEVSLVSETFNPAKVESFFGFGGLFGRINLMLYKAMRNPTQLGSASHLIHHSRGQDLIFKRFGLRPHQYDLVFSTQDEGYFPDWNVPVAQWGYFPRSFPRFLPGSFARAVRNLPVRLYYKRKISRIGLLLAISEYSKAHFESQWGRPCFLVYPPCNMVTAKQKREVVVTAARATPVKRLELFWKIARQRPEYEFLMLLTQDPSNLEYSAKLSSEAPKNGRTVINPPKEVYHDLVGRSKVYVHLMEKEPFGITVVEAMSASCVPIVHDSGGPKEIVRDGSGLIWSRADDIPSLVDEAMGKSPSAIASLRAREFSVEKFRERLFSILL